jgi:hypothetical protein
MGQPEALKLYAVTKISPISGVQHVMTLLMTPSQWEEIQPWIDPSLPRPGSGQVPKGRFLQDILPHHSPSEREFIISGTTQEEWDQLWGQDA